MALGTFIIDGAALEQLLHGPNGAVAQYVIRQATRVQASAQAKVGVKSGVARASIVKRFVDAGRDALAVAVGIFAGPATGYAIFHHEGTRPHVIAARRASVLAFDWPRVGRVVFFPKVNHPGTKPNHFLTDALKELTP